MSFTILLNTYPHTVQVLSVDMTDISGESQRDVSQLVMKTRLDEKTMQPILDAKVSIHPQSELEKLVSLHSPDWCGSCFGGLPPDSGCCQTCDEVRKAYMDRGWAFNDPDSIDQVRALPYTCLLYAPADRQTAS
jgi:hypothetical protein